MSFVSLSKFHLISFTCRIALATAGLLFLWPGISIHVKTINSASTPRTMQVWSFSFAPKIYFFLTPKPNGGKILPLLGPWAEVSSYPSTQGQPFPGQGGWGAVLVWNSHSPLQHRPKETSLCGKGQASCSPGLGWWHSLGWQQECRNLGIFLGSGSSTLAPLSKVYIQSFGPSEPPPPSGLSDSWVNHSQSSEFPLQICFKPLVTKCGPGACESSVARKSRMWAWESDNLRSNPSPTGVPGTSFSQHFWVLDSSFLKWGC